MSPPSHQNYVGQRILRVEDAPIARARAVHRRLAGQAGNVARRHSPLTARARRHRRDRHVEGSSTAWRASGRYRPGRRGTDRSVDRRVRHPDDVLRNRRRPRALCRRTGRGRLCGDAVSRRRCSRPYSGRLPTAAGRRRSSRGSTARRAGSSSRGRLRMSCRIGNSNTATRTRLCRRDKRQMTSRLPIRATRSPRWRATPSSRSTCKTPADTTSHRTSRVRFRLHPVMARALRIPGSRLRHRSPSSRADSFGSKLALFPYIVVLCICARIAGRPVKWIEDRLRASRRVERSRPIASRGSQAPMR